LRGLRAQRETKETKETKETRETKETKEIREMQGQGEIPAIEGIGATREILAIAGNGARRESGENRVLGGLQDPRVLWVLRALLLLLRKQSKESFIFQTCSSCLEKIEIE